MGKFLRFSDEHSTLMSMVRNLATNFVSPKFHVMFDEKFLTIQNDNRLEDTAVKAIFNDLFTNCRYFYGEGKPSPEETISAPEGSAVDPPPPKLGGECINKSERCDKDTCTEDWRARQHTILQNQAKQFQKINDVLQTIWPLDCDDVPSSYLTDDDYSIVEYDDDSIVSAAGPCCEALQGATEVVVPPPWL